jgi:hypothetical protein
MILPCGRHAKQKDYWKIATYITIVRRKRGRSRRIWREEAEEDLNVTGIKNRKAIVRERPSAIEGGIIGRDGT